MGARGLRIRFDEELISASVGGCIVGSMIQRLLTADVTMAVTIGLSVKILALG